VFSNGRSKRLVEFLVQYIFCALLVFDERFVFFCFFFLRREDIFCLVLLLFCDIFFLS
jgi:hypothetical protein